MIRSDYPSDIGIAVRAVYRQIQIEPALALASDRQRRCLHFREISGFFVDGLEASIAPRFVDGAGRNELGNLGYSVAFAAQ